MFGSANNVVWDDCKIMGQRFEEESLVGVIEGLIIRHHLASQC
jgi:hypothetical protein